MNGLCLLIMQREREMGSVCDCISCYSETMFVLLVYGDRVDEGVFPIEIAIDNEKIGYDRYNLSKILKNTNICPLFR